MEIPEAGNQLEHTDMAEGNRSMWGTDNVFSKPPEEYRERPVSRPTSRRQAVGSEADPVFPTEKS